VIELGEGLGVTVPAAFHQGTVAEGRGVHRHQFGLHSILLSGKKSKSNTSGADGNPSAPDVYAKLFSLHQGCQSTVQILILTLR